MSAVGGMVGEVLMLYWCVSYSFAVVGMAIFTDATSELLPSRYQHPVSCASATVLGMSTVDVIAPSKVGTDDVASEDASYTSLMETALSVCSQIGLFD